MAAHHDRIADVALRTAAGDGVWAGGTDLHSASGWCLAYARRVVELAYGWPAGHFYTLWGRERVDRAPGPPAGAWWARDMERSLRNLGYGVPAGQALQPGDLLFYWRAALNQHGVYVGHVGVLTHGDLVAENVSPAYRPHSLRRPGSVLLLTPLSRFAWSTAIRLPGPDPARADA